MSMHVVFEVLELMGIADEEIDEAIDRHPDEADILWHCFSMLQVDKLQFRALYTPAIYRAHCRELLERVACGEDLTRATDVEVCCALSEESLIAPLDAAAEGLYCRLWLRAGLPDYDGAIAEAAACHDSLAREHMDQCEAFLRRQFTDTARGIGDITCRAIHHGDDCRYAAAAHTH